MRTPSARTTVLTALALALPLGVLPASGADTGVVPGVQKQQVKGTIAAPTRFPDTATGSVDGGFPGLARRLYVAADPSNGAIARIFDVDPSTYGGAFVIDGVTDATGAADLDVFFYTEMGDVAGQRAGGVVGEYATRKAGGETGFVPKGAVKAIVFTPNGVNSAFTYTAFDLPKLRLGKDPLNVTVPAGTTLSFVNESGDYTFVRSAADSRGRRTFDSGSGAKQGLGVGESFAVTFAKAGTVPYETSFGTGTITVAPGPGVGTPTA
jgi:plastocyanin